MYDDQDYKEQQQDAYAARQQDRWEQGYDDAIALVWNCCQTKTESCSRYCKYLAGHQWGLQQSFLQHHANCMSNLAVLDAEYVEDIHFWNHNSAPAIVVGAFILLMKIRTIAVSYTRKFNLQNFNSVDLSCSLWAQIDAMENEDMCIQILQDKCREHVRNEFHKAKNGSKPVELFQVNVGDESDVESDNSSIYEGMQSSDFLDIGDK